jgi:hypothetical protein
MKKIMLAVILGLSLSSIVSADEDDYWNEMIDLGIPEVPEIAATQVNYAEQGVDAYYQTYYYD